MADKAQGPGDGTSLCGRLRARLTGQAKTAGAAPGPSQDEPRRLERLRARAMGRAIDAFKAPGPNERDEPLRRGAPGLM